MNVPTDSQMTSRDSRQLARAQEYVFNEPRYALALLNRLLNKGHQTQSIYTTRAKAYLNMGAHLRAFDSAEQALQFGPLNASLVALQLEAALAVGDHKSVVRLIAQSLNDPSLSRLLQQDLAQAAHLNNQNELAEMLYLRLLKEAPDNALYLTRLGAIKQKLGDMTAATECYVKAVNYRPDYAIAYNLLANVARSSHGDNHLSLLQRGLSECGKEPEGAALLNYALGKEYEDLNDPALAARHYAQGAAQMRSMFEYNSSAVADSFAITREHFTRHTTVNLPAASCLDADDMPTPVFIVGMPRTGSTLIERILSSHDEVVAMGELSSFKASMKGSVEYQGGDGFHRSFYQCNSAHINYAEIGRQYLELACPAATYVRYFTDKYPLNFMDLGTIARALPNARFIHTVRDPGAILWSNYKQIFTHGMYQYSYDLNECAQYISHYQQLMQFWHQQFPGRILDVKYEELVGDIRSGVSRLLTFLDLPWQDKCLQFHQQKSAVATASVSQVREPVYTRSVSAWKHYSRFLSPGLDQLEAMGIAPEREPVNVY
ncbi:tetratricopeptide repeat-containing sulfotransferase family protein [Alteromonas gilva]|uniref:Sulfotransferase n=1 Tax=Alteromonas gilva TaxID=2987522 RepID=A0ABT5L5Z2_9ALTE|nr:sulfotransferase [Alteromonas gilva]MDC8832465.1 sulfotransferase [Alteromonas gilva]